MKVFKNKRNYLITFDMDTKLMSELFGETKYRRAYKIMEKYFKSSSFKHEQGSVYITMNAIKKNDLYAIVDTFCNEFPYISSCIREISYAHAPIYHSLISYVKARTDFKIQQIKETEISSKEITPNQMLTPISQWEKDPTDDL